MSSQTIETCAPLQISDTDIYEAMKDIPGYLDITPGDFKEVYLKAYRHALNRLIRSVKASHVMTRDVATVFLKTSLGEVAEIMARRKISGVPVMNDDRTVAGIISERDFLVAMAGPGVQSFMDVIAQCLGGRACLAAPVRARIAADIMTAPAITVREEVPIVEVAGILEKEAINRVPVINAQGRLVGILSRDDIVRSSLVGEKAWATSPR